MLADHPLAADVPERTELSVPDELNVVADDSVTLVMLLRREPRDPREPREPVEAPLPRADLLDDHPLAADPPERTELSVAVELKVVADDSVMLVRLDPRDRREPREPRDPVEAPLPRADLLDDHPLAADPPERTELSVAVETKVAADDSVMLVRLDPPEPREEREPRLEAVLLLALETEDTLSG